MATMAVRGVACILGALSVVLRASSSQTYFAPQRSWLTWSLQVRHSVRSFLVAKYVERLLEADNRWTPTDPKP